MSFRRSSLSWLFAAAALATGLVVAAPASVPAPAAAAAPVAPVLPRSLEVPDGALIAGGGAPEVDLLYTGDVIGFIEPCG